MMLGKDQRKLNFHVSLYTLYVSITNSHNYQILRIQIESNLNIMYLINLIKQMANLIDHITKNIQEISKKPKLSLSQKLLPAKGSRLS